MTHDTTAPPSGPITSPVLPEDDEAPPSLNVPPIAAGEAELRLNAELDVLCAAFRRVEATGMAIARALDATAKAGTP